MRYVSGKAQDVARIELEAFARDEDRDVAFEAGKELARARQMRRARHHRVGRELHQLHELLGNRLGDERSRRDAAPARARREIFGGPAADLRARRGEELVDRRRQRSRDLHEDRERRIAVARFEVRDGGARHARGLRERVLREGAHLPQCREIARQMPRDEGWFVHRADLSPRMWTAGWKAPAMAVLSQTWTRA